MNEEHDWIVYVVSALAAGLVIYSMLFGRMP